MQVTDGSNRQIEKELERLRGIKDKSGTTVDHIRILEQKLEQRRQQQQNNQHWP